MPRKHNKQSENSANEKSNDKEVSKLEEEINVFFENTRTAIAITDANLKIQRINQQFRFLIAASDEIIIGNNNWLKLLSEETRIKLSSLNRQEIVNDQNNSIAYDIDFVNFEGKEKFGILTLGVLPNTENYIICIIDITNRKRVEETIKRERLTFRVLMESVLETKNITEFCNKVLNEFVEAFGFTYGIIRLFDSENRTLNEVTHINIINEYTSLGPKVSIDRQDLFITHVSRTKEPIFIANINLLSETDEIKKNLEKENIVSFITWPILTNEQRLLGVIQLISEKPSEFIEKDYSFFESIIILIATAIEKIQTEDELKVSEKRFRTTVDSMTDGIIIIEKGELVYANDQVMGIFGYPKNEIMKIKKFANVAPEELEKYKKEIAIILENKITYSELEYWLVQKKGDRRYVKIRQHINYTNGKPLDMFLIVTDLTEMKLAEDKLQRLNEELENRVKERTKQLELLNKELESFSYSVSHDLRTPLRSIDGFTQALAEELTEKLDTLSKDYLTRIRKATKRMNALIDDLLALSKFSKKEIQKAHFDLSKLVNIVVDEFRTNDLERNVETIVQKNIKLFADEILLRTVIENLIGNAWKFTTKQKNAKIEFGLTLINEEVVYFIKDNGIGFNQTYADKLFEVFQRLHSQQEFPGTGIGLAIVQRIISRHNGRIWAEGEEGKGATFYFTLPSTKKNN